MSQQESFKKEMEYYYTLYKHAFDLACKELAEAKEKDFKIVRDKFLERAKEGECYE